MLHTAYIYMEIRLATIFAECAMHTNNNDNNDSDYIMCMCLFNFMIMDNGLRPMR